MVRPKVNYKYILIGGGGHALRVFSSLNKNQKKNLLGYVDISKTKLNLKYLGDDKKFLKIFYSKKNIKLIMGIGIDIKLRDLFFKKYKNYLFDKVIDKSALIMDSVIEDGTVILSNCFIGPKTFIGKNTIIYTGSIIEHDSKIGENTYIGPGVLVCGGTKIGKNSFLGAKSCILENLKLSDSCKIGAYSLVNRSILKPNQFYIGIPAKKNEFRK